MSVFVGAGSLVCPLGTDVSGVFERMIGGESGLSEHDHFGQKVFVGKIGNELIDLKEDRTRLESMLIQSVKNSLAEIENLDLSRTGLIVATTKGNIDSISDSNSDQELSKLTQTLVSEFGIGGDSSVLSHACISGIMAVIWAARYIEAGKMDHCVVVGGDLASEFTLSGFMSLHAVSAERCKPYDAQRDGINLGEAATAAVVSKDSSIFKHQPFKYLAGSVSNDANHISGPSRTGEGLYRTIEKVKEQAGEVDIDFISAHGTGTSFNDEMESIAFERAGVSHLPVNSLKYYLGHTLGAAGLIETVLAMESLRQGKRIPSAGFSEKGTSRQMNVISEVEPTSGSTFLKTASGFGGCNASMILSK